MESKKINHTLATWTMMLALALSPVLYSYVSSFNVRYCDIFFLIVLLVIFFTNKPKNVFIFPKFYLIFWLYAATALILVSSGFKITYLIPGGIAFTIFSLFWSSSSKFFSIDVFYKLTKFIFYLSFIVFVAQLLHLLSPQYQMSAILPISDHVAYTDTDYSDLMLLKDQGTRPSSFFLEPAYYAQFLLIYLTLELFYKTRKKVLFTIHSLICIITILLLKSGLGLAGLSTLVALRLYVSLKESKNTRTVVLFILPFVIGAIYYYFTTESGVAMWDRRLEFTTEGSSGFLRVVQGFMIFDALPLPNKILGVSMDEVMNMSLPFLTYDSNGEVRMFTNGFCTLLLRMGVVGTLLLFMVYYFIWRNGKTISRVLLVLLFVISIIEQVYLSTSMLIISVIASCELARTSENENSISFSNSTL